MSVDEAVAFLQKNSPAIRDICTPAAIPEILTRCREKGLLSLEEKEICDNSNLTNAGKWDRISDMLQIKREITLDGVWEIFSGESSKHILKYIKRFHMPNDIPNVHNQSLIRDGKPSGEEILKNLASRGSHQSPKLIPQENISQIDIVGSEYKLDEGNVEAILNGAKDNYTVKKLECVNISTRRVRQILNKFKLTETLKFKHEKSLSGYCFYLESRSDVKEKEEGCLFKMKDLEGFPDLKNLELRWIQVAFPRTFSNLPGLKKLFLECCDISGDLINNFVCHSTLQDLQLYGNTPYLTKEDVEKLLRSKTLKFIGFGKHYREIVATCFTSIGPDGRSMEKITPNSKIFFQRESFAQPWVQTIEFLDIVDNIFNLTSDNMDLILKSPNVNIPVGWLNCSNISTRRIPDTLKKFKNIQTLEFWHHMNMDGKCLIKPRKESYLNYFREKSDCLIKMIELDGFEYLTSLYFEGVEVAFPASLAEKIANLNFLRIISCYLKGNFIESLSSCATLIELELSGITPCLTKADVEGLLRSKFLNSIKLGERNNREIFKSSFRPIGPNGNPMGEITQNTKIRFRRASFDKIWTQNAYPVEDGEFHLNNRNIEYIFNSPKEYREVKKLKCRRIPTKKVPEILNKFKSIQKLQFDHQIDPNNMKCVYLGSISNAKVEDVCLFKIEDLMVVSNLMVLKLCKIDVDFPRTFPKLSGLKKLFLKYCDISGDLINDFIYQSNLEELELWGIAPSLMKEDVEKLLRNKSLKKIILSKFHREILTNSFRPIGIDGNLMKEISPNSKIEFTRDSNEQPWDQKVEQIKE